MKILVIADEESRSLWDFYQPGKLDGIDLIISCGDLKQEYLQFLVTLGNCPLLYVHGNHDAHYLDSPPLGCEDIDDCVFYYKGLRIVGLGGSNRYRPGPYMYTEKEMAKRISKLRGKIRRAGGVDILVTHAPARGYGDMDDIPHMGFESFNTFIEKYHPGYMLHGHVHKTYGHFKRFREHEFGAEIINGFESCILEIPDSMLEENSRKTRKKWSPLYKFACRFCSTGEDAMYLL